MSNVVGQDNDKDITFRVTLLYVQLAESCSLFAKMHNQLYGKFSIL